MPSNIAAMARHWLGIEVEVAAGKCLCSLPEIRVIDNATVAGGGSGIFAPIIEGAYLLFGCGGDHQHWSLH